jgi:hypothetical protein
MCLVWLSQQAAIISVNSINRMIFVMDKYYVFSEVETEIVGPVAQINYKLQYILHLYVALLLSGLQYSRFRSITVWSILILSPSAIISQK